MCRCPPGGSGLRTPQHTPGRAQSVLSRGTGPAVPRGSRGSEDPAGLDASERRGEAAGRRGAVVGWGWGGFGFVSSLVGFIVVCGFGVGLGCSHPPPFFFWWVFGWFCRLFYFSLVLFVQVLGVWGLFWGLLGFFHDFRFFLGGFFNFFFMTFYSLFMGGFFGAISFCFVVLVAFWACSFFLVLFARVLG